MKLDDPAAAAGTSGTVLYWDTANSTPIEDVRNMKRQVQLASGGSGGSEGWARATAVTHTTPAIATTG